MTSPVNPQLLTLNTALETCRPCPTNEKCAICQEMLTDAPPDYNSGATLEANSESEPKNHADSSTTQQLPADDDTDSDAVKSKVCGDAHFFHRICIMSWFKSAVPSLNSCPIDRKVLFGSHLVRQRVTNFAIGVDHIHDDDDMIEHELVLANEAIVIATMATEAAEAAIAAAEATMQPQRALGISESIIQTARANVAAAMANMDASRAAVVAARTSISTYWRALPGRAYDDVAEPEAGNSAVPPGASLIEASSNNDEAYVQDADHDLAARITQGIEPVPRGCPFGNEVDPAANRDFPINPNLVDLFAATQLGSEEGLMLLGLMPDSLEHEVPEEDIDTPFGPATLPDDDED